MSSIETLQFELSQIQVVKKKSTFDEDSHENQSASADKNANVKGMKKSTKRNLIYRQIEEEEGSGDDSDSEIMTKRQMKKKDKMSEKP